MLKVSGNRLSAILQAQDYETGEVYVEDSPEVVRIRDLSESCKTNLKLATAWDALVDAIGEIYNGTETLVPKTREAS